MARHLASLSCGVLGDALGVAAGSVAASVGGVDAVTATVRAAAAAAAVFVPEVARLRGEGRARARRPVGARPTWAAPDQGRRRVADREEDARPASLVVEPERSETVVRAHLGFGSDDVREGVGDKRVVSSQLGLAMRIGLYGPLDPPRVNACPSPPPSF